MTHTRSAMRCDFCDIGRVIKRRLRIAFRQETDLGYVSCLAEVPLGVCERCGCKNWNEEAEIITEDTVRREYFKLLSKRRRSSDPYQADLKLRSMYRHSAPYALDTVATVPPLRGCH
jgi:hypothetical protein